MGYTLNTMEKPCVHKDHGGVKDKEPRTVLEPYIYTRTKPRTKSKAHQVPSKTTSPCRRLRCTDVHACHLFQSKGQEPRMQAHGACASSHMVRWHMQTCMFYIYKIKKTRKDISSIHAKKSTRLLPSYGHLSVQAFVDDDSYFTNAEGRTSL